MAVVKDVWTIARIVTLVVSAFNLNSIQENKLRNYVNLKQMTWIAAMKDESEIQAEIQRRVDEIIMGIK